MLVVWIGVGVLAVCLIVLAIAYYTYRVAFYSPKNRKENIYDIPDEEQYRAGRTVMIAAIDEMKALPFEEVSILSHDGTTMSAMTRLYRYSSTAIAVRRIEIFAGDISSRGRWGKTPSLSINGRTVRARGRQLLLESTSG